MAETNSKLLLECPLLCVIYGPAGMQWHGGCCTNIEIVYGLPAPQAPQYPGHSYYGTKQCYVQDLYGYTTTKKHSYVNVVSVSITWTSIWYIIHVIGWGLGAGGFRFFFWLIGGCCHESPNWELGNGPGGRKSGPKELWKGQNWGSKKQR